MMELKRFKVTGKAHYEYDVTASDEQDAIDRALEEFDDNVSRLIVSDPAGVLTWEAKNMFEDLDRKIEEVKRWIICDCDFCMLMRKGCGVRKLRKYLMALEKERDMTGNRRQNGDSQSSDCTESMEVLCMQ